MTVRAALYARYSSDQQRAASIEDQFRICREHAAREGWKVAAAYKDSAVSGDSVILRPGIRALLEDAGRSEFEVVVAEALDRVSRVPGRCSDVLQTSALRGRDGGHARGGRDRRASRGSQGQDERAVPEGSRGEDAPGSSGPGRGGQVGRQHLLRLRGGESARCAGRADTGRAQDRRGAGRDRPADIPGICGGGEPARDHAVPQRRRNPRPVGRAVERQHAARPREAGHGSAQQRTLCRAAGVEPPAPGEKPGDGPEGIADQPAGGVDRHGSSRAPHRR